MRVVQTKHLFSRSDFNAIRWHVPPEMNARFILSRYAELKADRKLLIKQLKVDLRAQPPQRIPLVAHSGCLSTTYYIGSFPKSCTW
jgi:hypothetical protein